MEKDKAAPSCSRDGGGPQVAVLELVDGLPRINSRARIHGQGRAT